MRSWIQYSEPGGILDADFLQYYSRDLYESIEADEVRTYGLIGSLPMESRLSQEEFGGPVFDDAAYTNVRIEYWLHTLAWMKTKDGEKNVNRPEMMIPPHVKQRITQAEQPEESDDELFELIQSGGNSDDIRKLLEQNREMT